jgi:hypothetical protein
MHWSAKKRLKNYRRKTDSKRPLGTGRRIMLKHVVKKFGSKLWIRFFWLKNEVQCVAILFTIMKIRVL